MLSTAILQCLPCKVPDFKSLLADCFVYFGILFSGSLPEHVFCLLFWVFFGATFGFLLVPKVALGLVWEAFKNDAKKDWDKFTHLGKWGAAL